MTIEKDLKIYSVNPFYLIFGKVNGYFEEINGNKYLTLVPANERKEKRKKYKELWIKIRDLISSLDDYDEKYIKTKFDADDELPINKTVEVPIMTIVFTNVFLENNKYYTQVLRYMSVYNINEK